MTDRCGCGHFYHSFLDVGRCCVQTPIHLSNCDCISSSVGRNEHLWTPFGLPPTTTPSLIHPPPIAMSLILECDQFVHSCLAFVVLRFHLLVQLVVAVFSEGSNAYNLSIVGYAPKAGKVKVTCQISCCCSPQQLQEQLVLCAGFLPGGDTVVHSQYEISLLFHSTYSQYGRQATTARRTGLVSLE